MTAINWTINLADCEPACLFSGCSGSCGACGMRKRLRACYGGNAKCRFVFVIAIYLLFSVGQSVEWAGPGCRGRGRWDIAGTPNVWLGVCVANCLMIIINDVYFEKGPELPNGALRAPAMPSRERWRRQRRRYPVVWWEWEVGDDQRDHRQPEQESPK